MEADDPQQVMLSVDLVEALSNAGDIERAGEVLRDATETVHRLGDERLRAHVLMGELYFKQVEGPRDVELVERSGLEAAEVFRKHGDARGLARAWDMIGAARWWAGRAAGAEEALERARRHAAAAGDTRKEADTMLTLSAVLVQGPQPAEEASRRAERILEEHPGHRTVEAYMSHALAHLRAWQGRFDEARKLARRYRDILRENGQEANWADSAECEGDVELLAENVDEAVHIIAEGQRRFDEMGVTETTNLPFLAAALYAAGRWQEAEVPAGRAIEGGHPLWKMQGQVVLAKVRARQGLTEEAERLAREALVAAGKTDYLVFQGRAASGMAEVLEILGREEEATPFRREAVRVYEQKGAAVLAEQARSETR
jgi:tetratricopeptide (TPR) repeat protein